MDRGTRLYNDGKYAAACLEFRRAIQQDAKFGPAYLSLGEAELKLEEPGIAIDAFRSAGQLMPANPEPKAQLANVYLTSYLADPYKSAPLYKQISRLSDQILKANPNSFAGLRLEGYLAVANNNFEEAVHYFERANQVKPDQLDVITMLVQNLLRSGESKKAETLAASFIHRQKSSADPVYGVLYHHYLDQHQFGEAEKVLTDKIGNNPHDSYSVTELCRFFWIAGQHDRVQACMARLTSGAYAPAEAHLAAGDFYTDINNLSAAISEYRAGLSTESSQKVELQKHLATVLIYFGKNKDAAALLEEVIAKRSDDLGSQAALAALRATDGDSGDLEQAIETFKNLLRIHPGDVTYHYQLGRAYELRKNETAAREQYLKALAVDKEHIPSLEALAHLWLRAQNFPEAKQYANSILKINPKDVSARLVLSASWAALGDYAQAHLILQKVLVENPQLEEGYLQLGMLNLAQQRYGEAETLFQKLYVQNHDDKTLRALVEVYRVQKHWNIAIKLLQRELVKYPESLVIRRLLADTAVLANDDQIALEQYQKILQTNPQDPLLSSLVAESLQKLGKKSDAINKYKDSLRLDPGNAAIENNLAYAIADADGNFEEALQLVRAAIQKNNANLAFIDTLGFVYLKKKDFTDAQAVFEKLRNKQPADVDIRIQLATVYVRAGHGKDAATELRVAQTLKPSDEERMRINRLKSEIVE